MPVSVKTGTTWKEATVWVKHLGAWKEATVWVRDSGVWHQTTQELTLILATDTQDYNIKAEALAAGWNGVSPIRIHLTINSGVSVYGSAPATPAIDTGTFGVELLEMTLTNNGTIIGAGGSGGAGGGGAGLSGGNGTAGGTALKARCPITVTNNGTIAGGGGGGAGGDGDFDTHTPGEEG